MKPLSVDPAAEEELRAAVAWYEVQQQGLGVQFFAEVGRLLDLILRHPGMGSLVLSPDHIDLLKPSAVYGLHRTSLL